MSKYIEQAITELKEIERPHKDELLPAWWVLDKILKHVDEALALLDQAEPPAGEFTKKYRESLRYCTNTITEGYEACDLLDAQQQEIEKLKVINKGDFKEIDVLGSEVARLSAENKAQAERIEKLESQLTSKRDIMSDMGFTKVEQALKEEKPE